MRARAHSARRPCATARRGRLRRGCRLQLLFLRLDRAEALREPGPGPWLELLVPKLRLASRGLEVLEPGVRLLDQQQLVRVASRSHWMGRTIGPGPDSKGRRDRLVP